MAPKQPSTTGRGRPAGSASKGGVSKTTAKASSKVRSTATSSKGPSRRSEDDPFASSQPERGDQTAVEEGEDEEQEEGEEEQRTIPPALLTRLLYESFEKEGTRISKDANKAVAKYMDIFVREAIARAAVEREGGFLEVEDLEKIAPQLLFDI